MTKIEKCLIIGPSGSGKDFLLRKLKDLGLKTSVKITTRPKRENEIEGINYHFIQDDSFDKLDLIVKEEFINDRGDIWNYGVLKEDFNNSQVFILTPGELSQIPTDIRKNCFVVYLDIDRKIRENRIFKRNDSNDSIVRRLDADDLDFKNFNDYDLKITDPEFEAESVLSLMY